MGLKGLYATDYESAVDFDALSKARLRRAREAMAKLGVDALLLAKQANVRYVTSTRNLDVMGRGAGLPGAVLTQAVDAPYVWTTTPEDVPPSIPRDHVFPMTWHPVSHIGKIVSLLGPAVKGRVAVDAMAPYFVSALNAMVPNVNLVDGNAVMYEARKVKTPDEIECLRIAHRIVGVGMDKVLEQLKPGIRDIDLHGIFLQELSRWGVTFPIGAGAYTAQPKRRADAPWALDGVVPYRQLANDAIFGEGELVTIDTGAFYLGYAGLFCRTWYCSWNARPGPKEKELFRRWKESFERLAERCRPGVSIAEVRQALGDADAPRYLIHGVGLGLEPPVGAKGLGPDLEKSWVLEPGMVLSLAPYVWEEGVGGFRASETLLVTANGRQQISDFPHGPLAD